MVTMATMTTTTVMALEMAMVTKCMPMYKTCTWICSTGFQKFLNALLEAIRSYRVYVARCGKMAKKGSGFSKGGWLEITVVGMAENMTRTTRGKG